MRQPRRVLNLVTNGDARCFNRQVRVLEDIGVETTNLAVPKPTDTDNESTHRSIDDYLRFYPSALRHSFGDYDLVHANFGLTGPAAVAQPNLPVVLSLWGTDLFGKYGKVSKWCARRADAVIVMSDVMAEELDTDCYVIPHGIDMDQFEPRDHEAAQRELGWDPDTHHVLFPYPPSRPEKDFPRAERVVDRARRRVDREVILHNETGIPYDDMSTYMNAADVFLMTSTYEGSPSTIKESLACNLPVVSTDVGDVRERLEGVDPSFVGRTDDELVDGLFEVFERDERSNGRDAVLPFSSEAMGQQIYEVYEDVLNPGRTVDRERPRLHSAAMNR